MPLNLELVPIGMNVIKEVTSHCFINGNGQVVFLRKKNGETGVVVLNTIYDAISQCFHILDRTLGEVVDFYKRQPEVYGQGELADIREIMLELQHVLQLVTLPGVVPYEDTLVAQRRLNQIPRRLGQVRNRHKVLLVAHLNRISELRNGEGMRSVGAVLEPVQAHLAAVRRFDELDGIIQGVMIQARKLIEMTANAEDRIRSVYDNLGVYEHKALALAQQMEKREEAEGVQPVAEYIEKFRTIANAVAGGKVNKVVYALRAIVLVEPFKSRLESPNVKCLEKLHSYLEDWEKGNIKALQTFLHAFGRARSKLKRVVRERKASAQERTLEREYVARR
ncbi:MAG: hypothetical protein Q8Q95_03960 [bacterium]|nr:hypothetical protein [bacterium]